METRIRHPMRYVARQTGLKPYLIRTWEERYGAVSPQRSASNRRLYSDADIQRLSLLKQAVDGGHAISTVAPLGDRDLRELLQQRGPHEPGSPANLNSGPLAGDAAQRVESALEHVLGLDPRGLESVLNDAAVEMPRQAFLEHLVFPLFTRVGDLWQAGRMKIINEHMASVIVRAMLWDMLRGVDVAETAPRIVVATPVGHWHEFGALASALVASESGWKACYFGPNLPSEEIAYAVRKLEARALCLSLCHRIGDRTVPGELTRLRELMGPATAVFVGGAGADAALETIRRIDGRLVNDFKTFRRLLEQLASEGSATAPPVPPA